MNNDCSGRFETLKHAEMKGEYVFCIRLCRLLFKALNFDNILYFVEENGL